MELNPVRRMIRRDLAEVLEADWLGYELSWTEEDFLRCLRQRNCIGMVAEQGEEVVGFLIYELQEKYVKIVRMAIHPRRRRQGWGRKLVEKILSKLSSHRRTVVTVSVPERALPAQMFFKKMGFRASGVEDGEVLFAYRLGERVKA